MGRVTDFSSINGIAEIVWDVTTKTSLCIKAGTTSGWRQASSPDKLRLVDASLDFFQKERQTTDGATLADFYYDTRIRNDQVEVQYCIPSRSVRGALRNQTIKRLVMEKEYWNAGLYGVRKDGASEEMLREGAETLKAALKTPGWHLVQNLFGLGVDSGDDGLDDESVAGRLSIMVGDLKKQSGDEFKKTLISGSFIQNGFTPGSTHGKMVITTRSPLDHIIHAAKDGGLHSFMELAPGNQFSITIRIVNPKPEDLGLVAFWEREINNGLLRLGGLTSVGRGRLHIDDNASLKLFSRSNNGFPGFESSGKQGGDILSGLFPEYSMSQWNRHKKTYLGKLKAFYENHNGGE